MEHNGKTASISHAGHDSARAVFSMIAAQHNIEINRKNLDEVVNGQAREYGVATPTHILTIEAYEI